MAWTPKTGNQRPVTGDGAPTPSPPRRRRRLPAPEVTPEGAVVPSSTSTKRRRRLAAEARETELPNLSQVEKANPRTSTGNRPKGGDNDQEKDDRLRVKVRLGKRWSEIVLAIKRNEYTWQEFVEGLDEAELARGQLRSEDGGFLGRPPSMVPREFLLACQREQQRRFEEIFGSEVLGIAKQYVELCKDSDIPPKERARMMQYAMERIFGGIPKDVRVSQAQPWEAMFVNVTSGDGSTDMPEHLGRRYEGYAERQGEGVPDDKD